MNNKLKIALIISTTLLAIALVYLAFVCSQNNHKIITNKQPVEIMGEAERKELNLYRLGVYEVVSRDESGKIATYRMIDINDEQPIELEFMTEAEKVARGLDITKKIQVLSRDENGLPNAFKILKRDNDYLTKY